MSKLVIKNLPENKELDHEVLAEFRGGINPSRWLTQIGKETQITKDQEPELGVSQQLRSIGLLQNQPFTPHSQFF